MLLTAKLNDFGGQSLCYWKHILNTSFTIGYENKTITRFTTCPHGVQTRPNTVIV